MNLFPASCGKAQSCKRCHSAEGIHRGLGSPQRRSQTACQTLSVSTNLRILRDVAAIAASPLRLRKPRRWHSSLSPMSESHSRSSRSVPPVDQVTGVGIGARSPARLSGSQPAGFLGRGPSEMFAGLNRWIATK